MVNLELLKSEFSQEVINMKIEKVNNNQIRCTLTKKDLADRELKLSELAYGTEKAKRLFRDMMQQASYEVGFEAEDIPLMIEAIPVSEDCIILTITKVENPDELDTRFSKFSAEDNSENDDLNEAALLKGADEIIDLYKKIREEKLRMEKQQSDDFVPLDKTIKSDNADTKPDNTTQKTEEAPKENKEMTFNLVKIFQINDLDTICQLSVILKNFYNGVNSLYKDSESNKYFLLLNKNSHTPEEFNKTCNIAAEYGVSTSFSTGSEEFFNEHYQVIIKDKAIQVLSNI